MRDFWMRLGRVAPVWQGEGGGGAGAGAGGEGAGGDAAAAALAAASAAAGQGAADPGKQVDGAGGTGAKWWEGAKFSDDQRKHLTASGLTVDDPLDALPKLTDMHRHAMQRLGKDPASFIDKPGKDQPVTEWMKANREIFGLPEAADGYKIEPPKDWPKEAAWDKDFEAQARAFAFENGLPPGAVQGMVNLYADKVKQIAAQAEGDFAKANDTMRADLARDWGGQADARMLRASQAAQAIAEKAGMTADQIADVAKSLSAKTGDANVIRMFDAIAQAMGDDTALALGKGNGGFGTTPAEARQQLAQLQSPGGAYFDAVQSGNSAKVAELKPTIERLSKIAAWG
jgi:hypothetical protein